MADRHQFFLFDQNPVRVARRTPNARDLWARIRRLLSRRSPLDLNEQS
jgi:hypothetical protein